MDNFKDYKVSIAVLFYTHKCLLKHGSVVLASHSICCNILLFAWFSQIFFVCFYLFFLLHPILLFCPSPPCIYCAATLSLLVFTSSYYFSSLRSYFPTPCSRHFTVFLFLTAFFSPRYFLFFLTFVHFIFSFHSAVNCPSVLQHLSLSL